MSYVEPADIEQILVSRHRLSASHASRIYAAGESGMGYHIFAVVFWPFRRRYYVRASFVDFIEYPWGARPSHIIKVQPHVANRQRIPAPAPVASVCVFAEIPEALPGPAG
jgi:hypothetical protein